MKKSYFFILCLFLFGIQNTFSQSFVGIKDQKPTPKNVIQLMVLDSILSASYNDEKSVFEYDNRGNVLSVKIRDAKSINQYNQDNLLISSSSSIWNEDSNRYIIQELNEYSYDNLSRLSQEFSTIYRVGPIWTLRYKTTYEYTNNLLSSKTYYSFNNNLNDWVSSYREDYIYNSNDSLIYKNLYYHTDDIQEYLSNQTTITYDENNNKINYLDQSFSSDSIINSGLRYDYTYNSDNLLVEEVRSSFRDLIWSKDDKQVFTYNADNLKVSRSHYLYYENEWTISSIDSFSYDSFSNQVNANTYAKANGSWVWVQKIIRVLDYNYTSDMILQPQTSPISTNTPFYFEKYSHLRSYFVYGYKIDPLDENSWDIDTVLFFHSLQSIVLSLPENVVDNGTSLMVYPNPTNEKTIISLVGVEGEIEISIFDVNSREIKRIVEKPIGNKLEVGIDVSSFKKGVYFINIRNGKFAQTKKLIVN